MVAGSDILGMVTGTITGSFSPDLLRQVVVGSNILLLKQWVLPGKPHCSSSREKMLGGLDRNAGKARLCI